MSMPPEQRKENHKPTPYPSSRRELAARLERENLQVAREVLELGRQFSNRHPTQRSVLSAVCGLELGGNCSISSDRTRRDDRTRWLLDQAAAEAGTTSSLDGAD